MKSDLEILFALDETDVANMVFGKIFERAYDYYLQRRVLNPRRIGAKLEAEVQGTELYHVCIEVEEGTVWSSCTCPFAGSSVCKHIGAVLLQWIHEPDSFQILKEKTAIEPTVPTEVKETPPKEALPLDKAPWWYEEPETTATLAAQDASTSNLQSLLEALTLNELRDIARQRGWRIKASNKAEYCAALLPLLTDPTEIARAVTSLSDPLREALRAAFVVEEGYGIQPTTLAQVITALRGRAGPELKPVEAVGLLDDLARWGLLIRWHESFDGKQRYLFPLVIQPHVPPLPGWCPQLPQAPAWQTQARKRDYILDLLYALWKRIGDQPPALRRREEKPSKERFRPIILDWEYDEEEGKEWARRSRERAASPLQMIPVPTPAYLLDDAALTELSALTGGNYEELEFLCHLLCELDLASPEEGYLLPRRDSMNQFLALPKVRQYAAIVQAYMVTQDWSELDILLRSDRRLMLWRRPIFMFTYSQFRFQLFRLRHALLRTLATAGEQGWCALADLGASFRLLWPQISNIFETHLYATIGALTPWGLAWHNDGHVLSGENERDWQAAQGSFLRALLSGPLFWLGFVELGLEDGKLVAIRLNGLAERMWKQTVPALEETPPREAVTIDETHHKITVHPGTVPPQAHALLGRIARLEEATPEQFVYRLDLHTAYATFERGESLDELLAGWEESLPVPMPSSLREVLTQWWAQYGQVRLYEGFTLLELSDDITLQELEASTSLRQHIVARLSPRLVLVADDAVDALLQAFIDKGYTPKEVR